MNRSGTPLVVAAFLAGCAAAKLLVIPPAVAQNAQRWDYFCAELSYGDMSGQSTRIKDIESTAKKAGAEGWEFIHRDGTILCFKRPLP